MAIRHVYLIRHGQYHLNREFKRYGTLTALGRRQSRGVARLLRSLPVTRLHCSDLSRARETATIIQQSLPELELNVSRRLRECFPGVPLSMIRKHHTELNDVELLHRFRNNKRFRQSIERGVGREVGFDPNQLAEGLSQVDRVFESYFKPARGRDKLEVVVCHGNLIRALFCRGMGVPAECWLSMMPVHCGITIIEIENAQRMRVLSFNESQHLPAHMRTEQ